MLTDDETAEQDELEEQLWTATEELQKAVMRLFQDRDIHPHLVVLPWRGAPGRSGRERRWRASRTRRSCWASWPGSCGGPGGSSGRWCRRRRCRPRGTPESVPTRLGGSLAYWPNRSNTSCSRNARRPERVFCIPWKVSSAWTAPWSAAVNWWTR